MFTAQLNERLRIPIEEEYYRQEERTGLSSLPGGINHEWYLGFEEFKNITGTVNKTLTRMVFLTRRFRLLVQFSQRLLSVLSELKDAQFKAERVKPMLEKTYHQWSQRISNRVGILESYEHHTECMQRRVENLNNRVCTNSHAPSMLQSTGI
jgi:hypothetical protein